MPVGVVTNRGSLAKTNSIGDPSKVRYSARQRFSMPTSATSMPALSMASLESTTKPDNKLMNRYVKKIFAKKVKAVLHFNFLTIFMCRVKRQSQAVSNLERVTEQNASSAESLTEPTSTKSEKLVKKRSISGAGPTASGAKKEASSSKLTGSVSSKSSKTSRSSGSTVEDSKKPGKPTPAAAPKPTSKEEVQQTSDKENSIPNTTNGLEQPPLEPVISSKSEQVNHRLPFYVQASFSRKNVLIGNFLLLF